MKNIDKTLKILSKSLEIEYPFLKKILFSSERGGIVFINIITNYNEFLELNNLRLREGLEEYMMKYPEDSNRVIDAEISFLNVLLLDQDKFGWKFNSEIESYLNEMLLMLPEELIPMYSFEGSFSTNDYPISFGVSKFMLEFNDERYLQYINR